MPWKTIKYVSILFAASFSPLCAMNESEGDEESGRIVAAKTIAVTNPQKEEEKIEEIYAAYLTKNSFVIGTTVFLTSRCEEWAVNVATSFVQDTGKSSNVLLDWTVSSALRGKTILEVLPIAQKTGKVIGITLGVVVAPIVWDCGVVLLRSSNKVIRYALQDEVSENQVPTKRDYLKAGLGTTLFGVICYSVYKAYNHYYLKG